MFEKAWFKHLLFLILFTVITLIMTYPVIFYWTDMIIGDRVDSLFNAWILAWDVKKITSGELLSIFNANIFYPHTNTLAYSEHMLGTSLWALPTLVISKNPVLTYNFVFLTGLILSVFGMYWLVFDLTGNRYAAVASAFIFGFFPWRFAHVFHLQMQMSQWIPLTFLFLHRFFKDGSYQNILLFTFFFILQFMSCGYYGVYLALFVCLLIIFSLLQRNASTKDRIIPLGVFAAISLLSIFPVYYPYIKVKQEMGFTRSLSETISFSPDLLSYLNTTMSNCVWGKATQQFWKPEGELFLGLTAIILGILGIITVIKRKDGSAGGIIPFINKNTASKIILAVLNVALFFYVLVALFVFTTGGISTTIWGVKISVKGLENPLLAVLIIGGIKLIIQRIVMGRFSTFGLSFNSPIPRFYFWVLLSSFILSFGPIIHSHGQEIFQYGPYAFLYYYFPGFSGLRCPSRLIIMVAFSLSVFAGFGLKGIIEKLKKTWAKILVTVFISLLLLFEYASIPVKMVPVPTDGKIPAVYQWLSEQKGDFPILELPLPNEPGDVWREAIRVYFSTYHWKKMVNGYSGYFPSDYDFLYQKGMKEFPAEESVSLLIKYGIKYLIIHFAEYEEQDRERIWKQIKGKEGQLKPVISFESDFVYEVFR